MAVTERQGSKPAYLNLRNFALVCKRWRVLIEDTPILWRTFSGIEPLPILDVVIPRARDMKLVVGNPAFCWRSIPLPNALKLFSEIPRTQAILCSVDSNDWLEMKPLFFVEAPEMETFKFKISPHSERYFMAPLLDGLFGGKPCPSLRHLSLVGCKVPWDSPLLAGLTSLFLNNQDRSTSDQLSDVLSRMPNLRDLHLTNCLPRQTDGPFRPRLPALSRLKLEDASDLCSWFLQSLGPCDLEQLSIVTDLKMVSDGLPIYRYATRLLSHRLSTHPLNHLRLIACKISVCFEAYHGAIIDQDNQVFNLHLTPARRVQPPIDTERLVDLGMKTLPLTHISSLVCDFNDTTRPSFWREIVSPPLPNLRQVTLRSLSAVKGFFNALYYELVDRTEDPSAYAMMAFARVTRVIGEWPGDPDADYRPILLDRKKQGVPLTLEPYKRELLVEN
ncbi:hypothetical protein ONZ45_g6018 [Pleurotus djamor]|nr:hypothetical protein ONZ45_g6018 [Pleurotus djamor]